MVEGSQIDFAGEDNDSDLLIKEMIDFGEAVGAGIHDNTYIGKMLIELIQEKQFYE